MAQQKPTDLNIKVTVQLLDASKADAPKISAYAFSSEGTLLGTAPVSPQGTANLQIAATANDTKIRILAGPQEDKDNVSFSNLLRRGAQEKSHLLGTTKRSAEINFVIASSLWHCWLHSACFVRGTLNKRILVGGTHVDYPVCKATVEVYEVDPLWILIPRLNDSVIEQLRDLILRPQPQPDPRPDLFRGTLPGQDLRLPDRAPTTRLNDAIPVGGPLPQSSPAHPELPYLARQGSRLQLEQALIANPVLVRHLLCLHFPHLVTMQKVATALTDECGHFHTLFFKGCNNPDTPDLYFKAHQKLFGWFDVTIYAPKPISCYTHWNYVCGTEVNLYTSHPWAQTCSPCPPIIGPHGHNRWVAFMAIGAHGLNHIHGTSADLQPQVTTSNLGLTRTGAPWGGTLLPRLEFSNALQDTGAVYYRLSWRRNAGNNALPNYLPMDSGVKRYYRYDVPTPTGDMPAWSPESLGPFSVADGGGSEIPHLFKIPYPSVAPKGVWDVPPHITEIKEHFASSAFPTNEAAPGITFDDNGSPQGSDNSGKFQIKVDLFNATGQPIDIGAQNIVYAVPADPDESTGVINSTNAADLGLVHGNSLIITLHIDNNRCYAGINAPTINGAEADPCCGVLVYSPADTLTMSWNPTHPNGFATQRFFVKRGTSDVINTGWTPVNASGSPISKTVDDMLTANPAPGCEDTDCPVAGFAADLYVDALATDGWTSNLGYDDHEIRAFVLSNV